MVGMAADSTDDGERTSLEGHGDTGRTTAVQWC